MTMPTDIGAVDLMISFPVADHARTYDYLRPMLRDAGSGEMEMPAEYMFKDIPNRLEQGDDPVDITLAEMDKWGVDIGLIGLGREVMSGALRDHPDRFAGQPRGRPQRHHRHGAQDPRRPRGARHQGGHHVPGRLQPAGAGERPAVLPDLPDVHRPRHPDHLERGHRRDRGSRRRARTSCTSTRSVTTSPSCAS